jgi:hypothetical protein
MKTTLLFLALIVLSLQAYTQNDQITREGSKFFHNGQELTSAGLRDLLNSYEPSAAELRKANTNYTIGAIFLGGAVVALAVNLAQTVKQGQDAAQGKTGQQDYTASLVGLGLSALSLPFVIAGSSHAKKAIPVYNSKPNSNSTSLKLDMQVNQDGIGLCLRF